MKKGIQECLFKISKKTFILEEYHRHCEEGHYRIVQKTRDLFPCDFKFDTKVIVEKLGALLGLELTDIDPDTNKKLHIILRINRPNSTDYNPPHKDIYQQYDESGIVPKCVNFWIPICGVNKDSTLPLAVGSHLLSEDKIFRSFDGGFVNGKAYNVRSVLHWGGDVRLTLPQVNDQQVLVFSSHLVHGCAINHQKDTTRIALEFRLFPKFKI